MEASVLYSLCGQRLTAILRSLLLFGMVICFKNHPRAQSAYKIDVGKVAEEGSRNEKVTGFLKMGSAVNPDGDRFSYNASYLTKSGEPWYPVMGEMHFSRVPARNWEKEILKMKACGIQVISTYIIWNHHEVMKGKFDWSGNRDLRSFINLCQKYHLYVWLRPGPWVHAEVRNGGFPDWLLQSGCKLRSSDPAFLGYVDSFFRQIAEQCKGLMFKEGGPVIGVQIENEFVFKSQAAYRYMRTLKEIAVRAGMDVPYYSAFAEGPTGQDEFLYMIGSYPDSPWSSSTKKLFKPVFFIRPLENDADIGADLLGKINRTVRNTYPKLSAEIGGGMQVTYHRRVEVSPRDVGANLLTKIAGGLNAVGYYMFHGGINPVGTTTLEESRSSQYPNDLPRINYDFQAPIGAMGQLSAAYGELHLLNLFLGDFGTRLAPMPAYFPEVRKTDLHSTDTVQCAVRMDSSGGFIFVSNYQRYVDLPAVADFRLTLTQNGHSETVPRKPMVFPANDYAIWPYHLFMEGVHVNYATAQPLCILKSSEVDTYVFFGQEQMAANVLFSLDKNSYKSCHVIQNGHFQAADGSLRCTSEKPALFELSARSGKKVRILVIPRAMAIHAYKFRKGHKDILLVTKGYAYQRGDQIRIGGLDSIGTGLAFQLYPAGHSQVLACSHAAQLLKDGADVFDHYRLEPERKTKGRLRVRAQAPAKTATDSSARAFEQSILRRYRHGKYFKASQRGPLYQAFFHDLPGQKNYRIDYQLPENPLILDWMMKIAYTGDVMALFDQRQRLVYDQFNYNGNCDFSPDYLTKSSKGSLMLQLLPGYTGMDVFWEDNFSQKNTIPAGLTGLQHLSLLPVYEFSLQVREAKDF